MRVAYFDCFSGISGDMALGALLDAGLEVEALRAELRKLALSGWHVEADHVVRGWLAGTKARVSAPEQDSHRHLRDVRQLIEESTLPPAVAAQSIAVFTLLAEAEGAVHGVAPEQVHFHEVGALDAIVDVVGVVAGLYLLGVERVYASALPLGTGWVRAAHGEIPIPGPAVLALLSGVQAPVLPDTTEAELVTPTGAALLAALATFARPAMRIERVGYGFGTRELARPNGLRVWLGSSDSAQQGDDRQAHGAHSHDHDHGSSGQAGQGEAARSEGLLPAGDYDEGALVLLETNIDDQPGEQLAFVAEQLLGLGARDAWATPILMKKGRPAILLSALVPAALEGAACELLFRETTTLGVRRRTVERHTCERESLQVTTALGPVRLKQKRWHGEVLGSEPEYEDCAALARHHGLPLRHVYALARAALHEA